MTKDELIQSIKESHLVTNKDDKDFVAIPQSTVHALVATLKLMTNEQEKAIKRFKV